MRTRIPTAYLSPLLPLAFTFGTGNVWEVVTSGGLTKDRAFLKAKCRLRRGKEYSPSFQIEKNADETDSGILKHAPGTRIALRISRPCWEVDAWIVRCPLRALPLSLKGNSTA